MRTAFMRELSAAAAADPRVMLVVGDLGFSVVEAFAAQRPDQYLNVGVAEQNMTGVAAGLALSGRIVFTYSIGNFPTLRCLEQLRNDVCYHNADVKVVAVGGGFAYGALGVSHHATEDLAIMRSLPNMTVVAPGDPVEAGLAVRAAIARPGPCYLRLGKAGETVVHQRPIVFEVGRAITVRGGDDLTLVSTGGMLPTAVEVADALRERHGLTARVLSMHTVKPLDIRAIHAAARETRAILTLEEHSVLGGLGGAVAEVLAEIDGARPRFRRLGLDSQFSRTVGDQSYLRDRFGLSVRSITAAAEALLASADQAGPRPEPQSGCA